MLRAQTIPVGANIHGSEQIVKLLLDRNARINTSNERFGDPLFAALMGGYGSIAQLFLDAGAKINVNSGHGYALLGASSRGHHELAKRLIDSYAMPKAHDGMFATLVQVALAQDDEQVAKLLLYSGIHEHSCRADYGNTLLMAAEEGYNQVVKQLIAFGVEVYVRGGFFGNALQAASARGHERTVKLLLTSGADVNAVDGYHAKALQAALVNGHPGIKKQLLDAGAIECFSDQSASYE